MSQHPLTVSGGRQRHYARCQNEFLNAHASNQRFTLVNASNIHLTVSKFLVEQSIPAISKDVANKITIICPE